MPYPVSWNPFGELARMRDEMRNFFADRPLCPAGTVLHRMPGPSVDVHETAKK